MVLKYTVPAVRHFYLFVPDFFTLYLQPLPNQPIYKLFEVITLTRSEIYRTLAPCGREKASCLAVLASLTTTNEVVLPLSVDLADDFSQKVWPSLIST